MPSASPFAAEQETRVTERQAVPVRSATDRPSYAETDLDIPSFLRRKND